MSKSRLLVPRLNFFKSVPSKEKVYVMEKLLEKGFVVVRTNTIPVTPDNTPRSKP